jgi:hypothetical protein
MDAPTRFYNGFYALLKVADNLLVDFFSMQQRMAYEVHAAQEAGDHPALLEKKER